MYRRTTDISLIFSVDDLIAASEAEFAEAAAAKAAEESRRDACLITCSMLATRIGTLEDCPHRQALTLVLDRLYLLAGVRPIVRRRSR